MITRAVIIDDEKSARIALRSKLEKNCPEVDILLDSDDLQVCIKIINESRPELIFLDIEMPEMSGFDFLEKLDNYKGEVVFVTAYNQFAIEAFKVLAFGYLLKPVSSKLLVELIDKLKSKTNIITDDFQFQKRIEELVLTRDQGIKKIAIPVANGYKFVSIDEIIRLEGASKYTIIHGKNLNLTSSKNIGYFNENLPSGKFFATHKSHTVNISCISDYNTEGEILLTNGTSVPLSRRRKSAFLNFFSKY